MSRGNRREYILCAGADKALFLETLAECCEMTGWEVHAYVLMRNHYHLLLETPEEKQQKRRLREKTIVLRKTYVRRCCDRAMLSI